MADETQTYASNGDPAQMGYVESSAHVPDPTAMTGTLETTGTGGGLNERISGTTGLFGHVERDIVAVRNIVQKGAERVVETVETVLHQVSEQPPTPPAEPKTAASSTKTTDKKTTSSSSDAAK